MSIVLVGSTSGSVTLQEPAVSGSTVIDLPATSGTMAVTGGSPSFATMTVTGNANFATSSGNVGIGTASPSVKLNVVGGNVIVSNTIPEVGISSSGSNRYALLYATSTSGTMYSGVNGTSAGAPIDIGGISDNATFFGSRSNHATQFISNNTVRATITSGGDFQFNSGYGSVATAYGCRSWLNCDGSATPPTIRASGNVSSVTRAATGTWDINFTTSLTDANYAIGIAIQPSVSNAGSDSFAENLAAGSYRLKHYEDGVLRNSVNVLSIVVR